MGKFVFEEREDHEAGFAGFFDREIAPHLQVMERQRAIARSQRIIALIAAVAVYLAWRAAYLDPILPVFPLAAGGFASLYFYIAGATRSRQN